MARPQWRLDTAQPTRLLQPLLTCIRSNACITRQTRVVVAELIKGMLPTLGLKIFLAVVPIVLRLVSRFIAGNYSESRVDFDVGRKYYFFQFVVIYVFLTIVSAASTAGGSDVIPSNSKFPIIDLLKALGNKASKVFNLLGASIPQAVRTHTCCFTAALSAWRRLVQVRRTLHTAGQPTTASAKHACAVTGCTCSRSCRSMGCWPILGDVPVSATRGRAHGYVHILRPRGGSSQPQCPRRPHHQSA